MGRKIIDETNNIYGKLTVLKRFGVDAHKHTLWLCQCSCGKIITVQASHLRNKHTSSCGCEKFIDETGNRYGKLTVIKKYGNDHFGKLLWECKCDCGGILITRANNLRIGDTNSCGCLNSLGELKISEILNSNNIPFIKQYSFDNLRSENNYPLRFDFAILTQDGKLSHLVEYDGIQHFESIPFFDKTTSLKIRQNRDMIKNDYCKSHNIKLIRLSSLENITLDKLL